MNKFSEKEWFIGGDLSKETIDLVVCSQSGEIQRDSKRVRNDLGGFEAMWEWLTKKSIDPKKSLFCFEHTGTYGLLLFSWLSAKEIDYCVEPALQIKRSVGMTRGKNDKIDAKRIAQYAYKQRDTLNSFTFPAKALLRIKQQLTYRDQLVRIRTSFMNSIKAHQQYEQVLNTDEISQDIKVQIEALTASIDRVEQQIHTIIREDKSLEKNFILAKSVKGVGLLIAAFILVSTNNFESFENGRKFSCYAGIAPFEHSSGQYKGKTRVSHLANKRIKALLSNGANSAIRWDPEIRSYYKRKTAEGKDHKLVVNAICCKLVNRVFAVVQRGTPFVQTYANLVN